MVKLLSFSTIYSNNNLIITVVINAIPAGSNIRSMMFFIISFFVHLTVAPHIGQQSNGYFILLKLHLLHFISPHLLLCRFVFHKIIWINIKKPTYQKQFIGFINHLFLHYETSIDFVLFNTL